MLKIECPACNEWLHSEFLIELDETKCPSCGEVIPVKDVYVSAGPYSIHRDILLGHLFKYKRLLKEAYKELEELNKKGEGLKSYGISAKTVELFVNNLREMLEGCRNGFRVDAEGTGAEFSAGGDAKGASLVNISISGACLKAEDPGSAPGKGADIKVRLPEEDGALEVEGYVVWTAGDGVFGTRFASLDAEKKELLLEYLKKKSGKGS